MCNIAGYVGNRQAAPILLEMLRAQQDFDGGLSTGVATVHEGKLYYRKMVGSVDDLIENTDVLDLPGTIGIAHSRPGGMAELIKPDEENHFSGTSVAARPRGANVGDAYHPFIAMNEDMALVTNGGHPPFCAFAKGWDEAVDELLDNGYFFRTEKYNPNNESPKRANGRFVMPPEVRVNLIDYYMKQGKSITEAFALSSTRMFADNVSVMINQNVPDKFFACRVSRPMCAVMSGGETYIATTRFAFPKEAVGEVFSLPLMHVCEITRDGVKITSDRIHRENVCPITPYAYHEAYDRIVTELRGKKDAPLYFDDLEFFVGREMKDIWPEQNTFVQHAALVYDVLWQLHTEGRLKTTILPKPTRYGPVNRIYMWLED